MCEKGSSVAIIPIKGIIAAFLFHIKLLCNDFIKKIWASTGNLRNRLTDNVRYPENEKGYNKMTEKELRRLSRMDLLEMLLEQSKEAEQLRAELETVKKQLEDRRIMEQEAGSIAEAALRLNKVFEAAQQAADQYLENIRTQAEISQNGETENEAE